MVADDPTMALPAPVRAADTQLWFDRMLAASPLMAILRGHGPQRSMELAEKAWELGIRLVEITLQSEVDLAALRRVSAAAAERGHVIGAGTVTCREQIAEARKAGASFVVSPGFDADVVDGCLQQGMPTLPGVCGATEIQQATRMGLRWLKAFPAIALGPGWFNAMRGPFPGVSMIATGGMDASNAGAFLAAGARAVAVGSALGDPHQLHQLTDLVRGRTG